MNNIVLTVTGIQDDDSEAVLAFGTVKDLGSKWGISLDQSVSKFKDALYTKFKHKAPYIQIEEK